MNQIQLFEEHDRLKIKHRELSKAAVEFLNLLNRIQPGKPDPALDRQLNKSIMRLYKLTNYDKIKA